MNYKVDLFDGKYTVILNEEVNNFKFEALRNGESWRNLVGDDLILGLVYKIQELEEILNSMT
jgi:hypothetical protein